MLPDLRFAFGAALASALLVVTALGVAATLRLAQHAKLGPLESSRSFAYSDQSDWNQFRDPTASRRFVEMMRPVDGASMPISDAAPADVPTPLASLPAPETAIPELATLAVSDEFTPTLPSVPPLTDAAPAEASNGLAADIVASVASAPAATATLGTDQAVAGAQIDPATPSPPIQPTPANPGPELAVPATDATTPAVPHATADAAIERAYTDGAATLAALDRPPLEVAPTATATTSPAQPGPADAPKINEKPAIVVAAIDPAGTAPPAAVTPTVETTPVAEPLAALPPGSAPVPPLPIAAAPADTVTIEPVLVANTHLADPGRLPVALSGDPAAAAAPPLPRAKPLHRKVGKPVPKVSGPLKNRS